MQVRAPVLEATPAGAYRRVLLAAPQIAERARAGQFVAVAAGEEPTATLLRRAFSLRRADTGTGTVELVVAARGVGSSWVTRRRPGDVLDVVGPLGRAFPPPGGPGPVLLVGGGYGAAPLLWLAEELTGAGSGVDVALGAAGAERLVGVERARALVGARRVHIATDDGSAGRRGLVTAVLPALSAGTVVYACGPMAMLRAVHELAAAAGARSWLTVEEAMACGIGVCMTCVLPVRGEDGATRMVRSCTEGPTFAGDAVRWEAVQAAAGGTGSLVPADCHGAAAMAGAHG